jgi:cytosine/adenosine deaminase-related metal-dependent hydrolase
VPVARPPIKDGWVTIEDGRIVDVGDEPSRPRVPSIARHVRQVDLGRVAVMPGLVNAHTHLELSWMRGRVGPAASFPAWIRRLLALRSTGVEPGADEIRRAIEHAIGEMRRAGTALVGDIGNTTASVGPLVASELSAVFFREVIGFRAEDPEALVAGVADEISRAPASSAVRFSLAAHAPYSVSPAVFRAIREWLMRRASSLGPSDPRTFGPSNLRTSVHLAESADELEFLQQGSGQWRSILESVGAWSDTWRPPSCGPVEYLERLGFMSARLLVVHGVHLTMDEMAALARAGATLVTCPRGNIATGAGVPPVAAFHRSGLRIAVGTDSLASVDDLNLFEELALLRRLSAEVPAGRLLTWATRNGAEALGFGTEFGSIEKGFRAALLAVPLPAGTADVEEYLVSGVDPAGLYWVDALL